MDINEPTTHQGHGDKFLKFVLEAVNSGILILNREQVIVFSNSKARKLISPQNSLVGLPFKELFPEEDREILATNLIKMAEKNGEFEGDVMLMRRDGQGLISRISIAGWKDGRERTFVVTISDISRLKDIERLLKSSERMIYLGQMLDDISHQIRNPVLAIGGFARRLMTTRLERPEYVKVIMEEARRLELLLQVLTRFIQLPRPSFALYKAQVIIDMIAELAKEICSEHGVSLRLSTLYDSRVEVVTDITLLKKAVEAVLINGCEACLEDSNQAFVRICFEQAGERPWSLKVSVEDSGQGIRPPLMERIFHPFFTTKTGHLGMGLTFTKRIMEEIGGRIHVESSLGKGTKVTLTLPGDRRKAIRTTPL